jgi:hypothetical protein
MDDVCVVLLLLSLFTTTTEKIMRLVFADFFCFWIWVSEGKRKNDVVTSADTTNRFNSSYYCLHRRPFLLQSRLGLHLLSCCCYSWSKLCCSVIKLYSAEIRTSCIVVRKDKTTGVTAARLLLLLPMPLLLTSFFFQATKRKNHCYDMRHVN